MSSSSTSSHQSPPPPTQSHLSTHVEIALDSYANNRANKRFTLLEGCIWHQQLNTILFVDIENPSIHVYNDKTNSHDRYPVDGRIGTVVGTSERSIIMYAAQRSADSGVSLLDTVTKKHYSYTQHPEWDKRDRNRFNDGKCSPDGLLYVGTMVLDEVQPRTADAALYVVQPDTTRSTSTSTSASTNNSNDDQYYKGYRGTISKVFGNATISNGIVWNLDHSKVYYIDTPTDRVDVFDYDIANHKIIVDSRKKCIETKGLDIGHPDGCTIDSEGMLWIAFWRGARVCRFDPANGKLLHTIMLPCTCITSVAFGGERLNDLYITTANNKVDVEKEPQAGSLFVVRNVGVSGVQPSVYKLTP